MRTRPTLLATLALALGCASSTDGGGNASLLTILGSAGLVGPLKAIATPVGAPASMSITMYKLALSPNADCTGAVEVQDYGAGGQVKDFTASPTLFQAQVDPGSYPCVAINLSDVIGFRSDTDSLSCQTGVDYTIDIYRPESNEQWLDVHQDSIVATGTDSTPSNDRPWIFFATDTAAALGSGYSHGQVIPLSNALTVPSTVTFVWDAAGAVVDEQGHCGMNPGRPSFQ